MAEPSSFNTALKGFHKEILADDLAKLSRTIFTREHTISFNRRDYGVQRRNKFKSSFHAFYPLWVRGWSCDPHGSYDGCFLPDLTGFARHTSTNQPLPLLIANKEG